MKSCPACAEQIQDAALKCRFCGEIVRTHQSLEPIEAALPRRSKLAYWARLLGCIPFIVMGVIGLMLGSFKLLLATLICGVIFFFCAYFAWDLGDRFRVFAMPTFYTANGAVNLAKMKLFWMYGPQFSGVWTLFLMAFVPTTLLLEFPQKLAPQGSPAEVTQLQNDMPAIAQEPEAPPVIEQAVAEAAPIVEDYMEHCASTAAGNQAEHLACLQAQFAEADQQLNATYKQKMQTLDSAQKAALRSDERAWVKSKMDSCQASANDIDGQISQTYCELKLTMHRLQELEELAY